MGRSFRTICVLVSLVSAFIFTACNAGIDLPEIDGTNVTNDQSFPRQNLVRTQTTVSPIEADANIEFSVVQNSTPVSLSSEDRVVFELRNSTMEIVNINKIADKQKNCPSNIKANLKEDSLIICNSYVKKQNLTDVVVFIGFQRLEVSSWIFEEEKDSNLVRLKIKLR